MMEKVSRYIPKLALTNVVHKKNRTMLSLVSVVLSTAIVYMSLTLFSTLFYLSKNIADDALGTAQYYLYSEVFDNESPLRFRTSYLSLPDDNNIATYIQNDDATFFELIEGRLPENKKELLGKEGSLGDKVEGKEVVGTYHYSEFAKEQLTSLPYLLSSEEMGEEGHYFVSDQRVQDRESLSIVAKYAHSNEDAITLCSERITHDTINNYLQDTTTILAMFIFITLLSIIMCLISIYNVLIVNDTDRRQEIGLLKSIGTTIKEIKTLLLLEMGIIGLVGAIIGTTLGMGLSSLVLLSVLKKLNTIFELEMIFNPIIIIVSMIAGIGLMACSGMWLYRAYFTSSPIQDLKGEVVQFDVPYDSNRFAITSVTWRMFVIYNERMKKQTKNLLRSFMMLLLTITLFTGIWFSNFLFTHNYKSIPYDFALNMATYKVHDRFTYPELDAPLYAMEKNADLGLERLEIQRHLYGAKAMMPLASFTDYYTKNREMTNFEAKGYEWTNEYHNLEIFNDMQFEEIEPYIVKGSLKNLGEDEVVLVINQWDRYINDEPIREYDLSYPILFQQPGSLSEIIEDQILKVGCIINLPKDIALKYSDLGEYVLSICMTPEFFNSINVKDITIHYEANITMAHASSHEKALNYIIQTLNHTSYTTQLALTDYVATVNDAKFAVFIIEALLYPLMLLLVVIGVVNINNVLRGNIQMKRKDFATMKSVGMEFKQLSMTLIYEYAENYINAGILTLLIMVPLYFTEKYFKIASTFKIGDNFIGMCVIAFCLIAPVFIIVLGALSFRHIKSISALDGMKNVE